MTLLSHKLEGVRPSQTKAATQRAAELRAAGHDIIVLSQGEPDFDTPENIRKAGIEAINGGHTRYTAVAGIPELKAAIRAKFKRDSDLDYKDDEIIVSAGAKQVLSNAFLATLNEGDEVIIPTPCWTSYPELVRICGGTPVLVDCTATDLRLTSELLRDALTEKTRWLLINSPSNPTGITYSPEELSAFAGILEDYPRTWVLSDDIYEHLIYGAQSFATMAQISDSLKSRTLTVNGVSKAYAMTGWRIGYGAGPKELIKAMTLLQSQMTSHPCSIAQYASVEALNGDQSFLETFVTAFRERRGRLVSRLSAIPGLSVDTVPDGAFYLYVSCRDAMGAITKHGSTLHSDSDFATFLLEEAGVAVTPGTAFLASPYIRISFASSLDELEEACNRIEAACNTLALRVARKATAS